MYKLIKHRGSHDKYIKENSYEGIKDSLNNDDYLGVEFDIRATKDDELVLFHDPFYKDKLISNTYYSELPKYVPKLEDILNISSNKIFLIEIKNIGNNYEKLINILDKHDDKNIWVMSFSNNSIRNINRKGRKYKIGVLNYVLNTSDDILKMDFICVLNSLITEDLINSHSNLIVVSYGINKIKKFKQIFYIVD